MAGSALALLIALLAWAEQIRSIARDTRELESGFLKARDIPRHEFMPLLEDRPDERLVGLTRLMKSGKLKTESEVQALGYFQQWATQAKKLRRLYSLKFWLTVGLTAALFVSGSISAIYDLAAGGSACLGLWLMLLPSLLILALLVVVVLAAREEDAFTSLLTSILDRI